MATGPNDVLRHKHNKIPLLGKVLGGPGEKPETRPSSTTSSSKKAETTLSSMAFTSSSECAELQAEPRPSAPPECRKHRRQAKKIPCGDELVRVAECVAARVHARIDLRSMD